MNSLIKHIFFIIAVSTVNISHANELISLPKVQLKDITETGNKYIVDAYGEVNINGKFVKRVEIGTSTNN